MQKTLGELLYIAIFTAPIIITALLLIGAVVFITKRLIKRYKNN